MTVGAGVVLRDERLAAALGKPDLEVIRDDGRPPEAVARGVVDKVLVGGAGRVGALVDAPVAARNLLAGRGPVHRRAVGALQERETVVIEGVRADFRGVQRAAGVRDDLELLDARRGTRDRERESFEYEQVLPERKGLLVAGVVVAAVDEHVARPLVDDVVRQERVAGGAARAVELDVVLVAGDARRVGDDGRNGPFADARRPRGDDVIPELGVDDRPVVARVEALGHYAHFDDGAFAHLRVGGGIVGVRLDAEVVLREVAQRLVADVILVEHEVVLHAGIGALRRDAPDRGARRRVDGVVHDRRDAVDDVHGRHEHAFLGQRGVLVDLVTLEGVRLVYGVLVRQERAGRVVGVEEVVRVDRVRPAQDDLPVHLRGLHDRSGRRGRKLEVEVEGALGQDVVGLELLDRADAVAGLRPHDAENDLLLVAGVHRERAGGHEEAAVGGRVLAALAVHVVLTPVGGRLVREHEAGHLGAAVAVAAEGHRRVVGPEALQVAVVVLGAVGVARRRAVDVVVVDEAGHGEALIVLVHRAVVVVVDAVVVDEGSLEEVVAERRRAAAVAEAAAVERVAVVDDAEAEQRVGADVVVVGVAEVRVCPEAQPGVVKLDVLLRLVDEFVLVERGVVERVGGVERERRRLDFEADRVGERREVLAGGVVHDPPDHLIAGERRAVAVGQVVVAGVAVAVGHRGAELERPVDHVLRGLLRRIVRLDILAGDLVHAVVGGAVGRGVARGVDGSGEELVFFAALGVGGRRHAQLVAGHAADPDAAGEDRGFVGALGHLVARVVGVAVEERAGVEHAGAHVVDVEVSGGAADGAVGGVFGSSLGGPVAGGFVLVFVRGGCRSSDRRKPPCGQEQPETDSSEHVYVRHGNTE